MADNIIQRASLFQETWKAIKASRRSWGPWVLGFALVLAVIQWLYIGGTAEGSDTIKQINQNPDLLKQHPEMAKEAIKEAGASGWMALVMLGQIVVQGVFIYVMAVRYLRFAMVKNQPTFSIGGFFHWLGQALWKYIRPILWMLIPFIGFIFYVRSIVRYSVVTPLAILHRSPELKTSWDLTKDNWWRIFGNQLGVGLVFGILVWGVALLPLIVAAAVTHADFHSPLFRGVLCLAQGASAGVMTMAGVIYSCTVYRVLLKERRPAAETPATKA